MRIIKLRFCKYSIMKLKFHIFPWKEKCKEKCYFFNMLSVSYIIMDMKWNIYRYNRVKKKVILYHLIFYPELTRFISTPNLTWMRGPLTANQILASLLIGSLFFSYKYYENWSFSILCSNNIWLRAMGQKSFHLLP